MTPVYFKPTFFRTNRDWMQSLSASVFFIFSTVYCPVIFGSPQAYQIIVDQEHKTIEWHEIPYDPQNFTNKSNDPSPALLPSPIFSHKQDQDQNQGYEKLKSFFSSKQVIHRRSFRCILDTLPEEIDTDVDCSAMEESLPNSISNEAAKDKKTHLFRFEKIQIPDTLHPMQSELTRAIRASNKEQPEATAAF